MTAPKNFLHAWEEYNERLLIFYFERFLELTKFIFEKLFRFINILAFIIYKVLFITGLLFRTAFLATPVVQNVTEETWLYRQVR